MQKSVLLRLLAVVLLFAAAAEAPAAAPVRKLPFAVGVHVAIKSPLDTLAALDGYVANASRGSQRHMPAGSIEMLARIYLPFPLDTWESEELAEVFFVLEDGGPDMKPVVVVQVGDFDLFLESLEEKGWTIDDDEDEESETAAEGGTPPSIHHVFMPEGQPMVLARLEGNLVALAEDPAHVALATTGDWRKTPASDADIVVTIANSPGREPYEAMAAAALAQRRKRSVDQLVGQGVKPEAAEGIFAALEKYIPLAAAQFDRYDGAVCEITLTPDNLLLNVGGRFSPDSIPGEMAHRLAESGSVANPLEANIPEGAVSYSVTAPLDAILPDAEKRIAALNGDVYGMVLPDLADRVKAATAAFFAAVDGGSVMANFAGGKGQYSMILLGSKEPGAAMKAIRDGVGVFNQGWAGCVADPEHALTLVETKGERDGVEYTMITPKPANPEKFRQFMSGVNALSRDTHLEIKAGENQRLFLAPLDGMLVMGLGEVDEEEFLATLATVRAKADSPMAERDAVKKLRPDLQNSQAAIGFVDADGAFRMMLEQLGRDMGAMVEPTYEKAIAKTLASLQKNGSVIGMSLGSASGNLLIDFAVPAASVNGIVRNYETFLMMRQMEAMRQQFEEDADENGEDEDAEEDVDEEEPEAA